MKTKRGVFRRPMEIALEDIDLPEPSENQVLIKSSVASINTGTELTILKGDFPPRSKWAEMFPYPYAMIASNIGTVIKKGSNVKRLEVGDRVASLAHVSPYDVLDVESPAYPIGTVMKVPEGISDEKACLRVAAITVMNSVRLARVSMGESVAVVGAGLIGQFAIMFNRLAGGYPVISIELSKAEKRIKIAQESGAIEIIKSDEENVEKKIHDITNGRMADVVFEVTGNPKVIPWAIRLTKQPQGRFIVLSAPKGPTQLDFHDESCAPSRIIIGTHVTSAPEYETPYNQWTANRNTELFFSLLKADIIKVDHLISHRYPWSEFKKAYEMLTEDRTQAMGVFIDFKEG